jgi:DNA-binding MarR family transcriptional regulator
MGKPVSARQQTGRVGQLLFVAEQAAQALAIERLEPLGLSPRAWGVLSTLAESGPLTQIELATTMSIDRTAMVYLLDELEDQALVERVRSPQDRRAFLISRPPCARRAHRRAAAALADAADILLTPLDAAERRHLVDLLAKVAAHWQQVSASQQNPGTSQTRPAAPRSKVPQQQGTQRPAQSVSTPTPQRLGRSNTSR